MTCAMILAAGRGERMRPLTDHCPKPLLTVAGKPLIIYHLERLVAAGIRDVVINIAHLAEQIPAALGDGSRWGLVLHYSRELPGELETAGGIKQALPMLGDEPFWVINGDVFTDYALPTVTSLALNCDAHLVLVDNPPHHPQGDFGLCDGQVVTAAPCYTFSGIGLYRPSLFAAVGPGRQRLGAMLRQRLADGRVSGEHYRGRWWDIGTVERLQQVEAELKTQ